MSMINSVRCAEPSISSQLRNDAARRSNHPPSSATAAGVVVSLSGPACTAGQSTHRSINPAAANPELAAYIAANAITVVSPAQQASTLIRQMFKDKWGQAVDPDNTFLTTFKYLDDGTGAAKPAEIVRRMSLTQAMLSNTQERANGEGQWQAFDPQGGPQFTLVPRLPTVDATLSTLPAVLTPLLRLAQATNPLLQWQPGVHTYEAIYRGGATQQYDRSTQLDVAPQAFRKAIWNQDPGQAHQRYLDQFWQAHEAAYPLLAKMAYVQAYQMQFQEGSLSREGRALAARVAGLRGTRQWQDLSLNALRSGSRPDRNLQVGLLDIHGYQATDILYATDKKRQTTLLYIPGNASPLHEFANPAAMKNWIAQQAGDSRKRAALLAHFKLADRPDGYTRAGAEEALQGLAAWPKVHYAAGGLLSFNRATFSGYWNPQTYVNQEAGISNDPFASIARQQKVRSYADAALLVRSDRDVRKAEASRYLEAAAMVLAPLALLVPGAGLAVDAALLSIGAAEIGIGADDIAHGKLAAGQGRIGFGLLNALPVAATAAASAMLKSVPRISNDIVAAGDAAQLTTATEETPALTPVLGGDAERVATQDQAAVDKRLLPYVSSRDRAGLRMDAQGRYWIAQRPYAAIGDHLFQIQKNTQGPGYHVLAEGEMVVRFAAPLLRRRVDGIWELVPAAGLRGGGDVEGASLADTESLNAGSAASFSSMASSSNPIPIPRAPLAQAQSDTNSLRSALAAPVPHTEAEAGGGVGNDASGIPVVTAAPVAGSSANRRFSYTRLAPPVRADLPPAVMQSEAQGIYDEVRALYKKGLKSSNKLRLNEAGAVLEKDGVRQIKAGTTLKKFIRPPHRSSDIAAAERLRAGNCYEMARSVIWRAQQQGLPVRLGYIAEDGDHFFAVIGDRLPDRVRHIDELSQAWVADPWAGIFAPAADYEERFIAKMNKWAQKNKIVCFKGTWMHASDPRWLNSVIGKFKALEPISYTPVVTAGSQTSSRLAGSCMGSLC